MYALHQKETAFFTASRCMQITQLADAWIRRAGDNCHRGWIASNTKCVGARFIAPVWGGGASPPTQRLWNCLQCQMRRGPIYRARVGWWGISPNASPMELPPMPNA